MIRITECLNNTMVCNSKRLVSPLLCPTNNCGDFGYTIEIRHLCMAVELNTLIYCSILSSNSEVTNSVDRIDSTDSKLL